MLCPNCSCKESRVIDSRSFDDGASIKRRRECLECGARFTTFERREEEPIMVLKRDGHVEPFDRSKLLKSLLSATAKRNVSLHTLEAFVDMVENDIRNTYRGPIPSSSLGDQVLIRLGDLDKVAYIRFASVYKDFKDIDELREELEHLTETAADAAVTADMQELEDEVRTSRSNSRSLMRGCLRPPMQIREMPDSTSTRPRTSRCSPESAP